MAIAVEVLDDRHAGLARDALDQPLAAARHDHVDVFGPADELADGGAVGGLDDLHRGVGQAGVAQAVAHAGGDRLIAVDRLLATAQDRRVAGLEAQRRGVGGDVGARFVDDADHAERHPHLAHLNAARAAFHVADLAHRIGQRGNLLQPLRHALHAGGGEREAVDQCGFERVGAGLRQIGGVGVEQRRLARAQVAGNGPQGGVLGFG